MKRVNWQNIRLILILFVMVFLYSFSVNRNQKRGFKEIKVVFNNEEENLFITHEMVNNFLIQTLGGSLSIEKDKVDLHLVEAALSNHEMVENAEVFSATDGTLNAQIKQKTPIIRYVSGSQMYYLDRKGNKMPLSENFSARVPVLNGDFQEEDKEGYVLLFNKIYEDEFLKKNITAITVLTTGDVVLRNRNYDFKIIFGKPISVEDKFANYKAFFQHAVKDTLIKNYKEVNLLFTDQVVCKK